MIPLLSPPTPSHPPNPSPENPLGGKCNRKAQPATFAPTKNPAERKKKKKKKFKVNPIYRTKISPSKSHFRLCKKQREKKPLSFCDLSNAPTLLLSPPLSTAALAQGTQHLHSAPLVDHHSIRPPISHPSSLILHPGSFPPPLHPPQLPLSPFPIHLRGSFTPKP